MKTLAKIWGDAVGLARVCGAFIALRWICNILLHSAAIMRRGNLQLADDAMGEGPFTVRVPRYGARFKVAGPNVFSGIREMYARDIYLDNGWLTIDPNAVVLDLGANMGNFSNLALAISPSARVIAVEPSAALNRRYLSSVGLNPGHLERTELIRAFLGTSNPKIDVVAATDPEYADAKWMSEEELIEHIHTDSIHLIKCDIEGGEFALLQPQSKLLAMSHALACEVHPFAGDVSRFLADVEAAGFFVHPVVSSPDGTTTFLAKRPSGSANN